MEFCYRELVSACNRTRILGDDICCCENGCECARRRCPCECECEREAMRRRAQRCCERARGACGCDE